MTEDPRVRLLQAAGPIFAAKGFEHATVREICQEAGVNLASVNYYFGDKESLYVETVKLARQARAALAPLVDWDSALPPEERLRQFIRGLLTRMLGQSEAPWQSQLMLREVLQPTRTCHALVEQHIGPEFAGLQQILAELLPPGTPSHVRQQLAFSLIGQCLFYRIAGTVVEMLVPVDEHARHFTIEEIAEHIHRTMMAAAGRRASALPGNAWARVG